MIKRKRFFCAIKKATGFYIQGRKKWVKIFIFTSRKERDKWVRLENEWGVDRCSHTPISAKDAKTWIKDPKEAWFFSAEDGVLIFERNTKKRTLKLVK